MTETLLNTSNILLFGRVVEDLTITTSSSTTVTAATLRHMRDLKGLDAGDGTELEVGNFVLVMEQEDAKANGIYAVGNDANKTWRKRQQRLQPRQGSIVEVTGGTRRGLWRRKRERSDDRYRFFRVGWRQTRKLGKNRFLDNQLDGMSIARIYGFSYEGTYYDLPRPVLFGVHGDGDPAVLRSNIDGPSNTNAQLARAPREPSISGVGAADFEFADDIRFWSYDKADYTIRLDIETGMFEQVLLDIFFDDWGWGGVSGAKVSGAKVSGAKVSGAKVSGAKVSGAKLSGMRFRGDPTD